MKKKGFTLIEVIIVLAMILILSSFFIPKLTSYQNKAKETKAVNTARQIYEAALSSYIEQNGKFIKGELKETINSLTMVTVDDAVIKLENGNKNAYISFQSDGSSYTVKIYAEDNKYEVCSVTKTGTEAKTVFSNVGNGK